MSARGNHSSFAKRFSRRVRALGRRFSAALAVMMLVSGLDAAAPALAETAIDLDIDGFGQAVAEFVDAAELVDVTELVDAADLPEAAWPDAAAPPELVDDALERVNASATTPWKTLTSSILNAAVPWVCEYAHVLAAAGAMAAGLVLVHVASRTREPEDFVPRD